MNDFNWLIAVLVFFIYFGLDAVWAYYTYAMVQLAPIKASLSAVVIYGLGVLGTLIYTENPWYVPFILLGSFFGTYFIVIRERKAKANTDGGN